MNKEVIDEYKKMEHELAEINTNRGSSADGLKGFYAERVNAAESNIDRIEKNIVAREEVIDDNGLRDAVVKYGNGQEGRGIQDKCGYTYSKYKYWLEEGKYDGMRLRINEDHPIFENEQQYEELKKIAKQHNVKIEKAKTTEHEMKKLAEYARREGKIRKKINLSNKAPVTAAVFTRKKFVEDSIDKYISEDLKRMHQAGLSAAAETAIFAGTLSIVNNTMAVVKDNRTKEDAIKSVVTDTATCATLSYATGAIQEKFQLGNDSTASLLVTGTVQISKQMIAYINGDIDDKQLMDGVAETAAYLTAAYIGKSVGKAVGNAILPGIGGMIGQCVGEMITTAICSEVVSVLKCSKQFDNKNAKIISLYHKAEIEIRDSQARLEVIIQQENSELIDTIRNGFEEIIVGIQSNSYEQVESGMVTIGGKFGMAKKDFTEDVVTRNNIFSNIDDILVIE